jgi:hypothetical protein
MRWRLVRRDLAFLVETLMPGYRDPEEALSLLAGEDEMIERMLDEDRLFERVTGEKEILVRISPWLFFTVLLRRARRDLEGEAFTVEERARQKVVLFDADQVTDLIADDEVVDYLATMLASFTRVHSVTVRYRVRQGIWRRYRTSELDVDGMIRAAERMDEPLRYAAYRRIGDVCLFLSGMFPEYIASQHRYPFSGQVRPRARGRLVVSREDYERHGAAFYRMAAEHEGAASEGLEDLLARLSEHFILAEKPLRFVANRYLQLTKGTLFDV